MKYIFHSSLLITAILASNGVALAQNEIDALRFSQTAPGGTARGIGLSGAMGAVGGDFSALSINPASIGVYRTSEFVFTPNLKFATAKTNYLGNDEQFTKTKMTISNFGVVFSNPARGNNYESKSWKASSFGIGFNRIADFNQDGIFSGNNTQSSMSDAFAVDARVNGVNYNSMPPFGSFAWNAYLLDNDMNSIPGEIIQNGGSLYQEKYWETKGGINEWSFTYGGNYKEKLFLGVSANVLGYKYDRYSSYLEKDLSGNTNNNFESSDFREYLKTTGTGFNLKIGALYNIADKGKIGAAFHTPTWIYLEDLADYEMYTKTEQLKRTLGGSDQNPDSYVAINDPLFFEYRLNTPWKATINAMAFLGKHGFISADYEYVGYNNMKYNMGLQYKDFTKSINNSIQNTFKGGHNIRVGIEGRYEGFMARIGGAYNSSPYQRKDLYLGDRFDFTIGIGTRFGKFFMDIAYINSTQKVGEYGYPMIASSVPVGIATVKNNNNAAVLTVGIKF